MSGAFYFECQVLGINEMVITFPVKFKRLSLIFCLEVQYFSYIIESLKSVWLYLFEVYFCGVWTFSPNWKHLLITVLGGAYCSSIASFCLLGLLAKLQKTTISIITSAYPAMTQLPLDAFS